MVRIHPPQPFSGTRFRVPIFYINPVDQRFRRNVPLDGYCTYGVGGPAAFFFEPKDGGELAAALEWASRTGTPRFILGRGSNLLVSDAGFPGLVIRTAEQLTRFNLRDDRLRAECGADFSEIVRAACSSGLSGLQDLYDIPGTAGGAVFMNAGAFGSQIADCVEEVVSLDTQGHEVRRMRGDLHFAYRDSDYRRNGETVLSVTLKLKEWDSRALLEHIDRVKKRRDEKQPPDRDKSCGSVFKRPPGGFAGTLIEQCGLKGSRLGGAKVSEKHANFIINDRHASASDIYGLIRLVQETVEREKGIKLEPEVVMLGEF